MLDDEQMQFATANAAGFERLIESDGWGALSMKAVEDIAEKQEGLLDGAITLDQVRFLQGYVAGVKALMTFPGMMIESAKLSEDHPDERLETRRQSRQAIVQSLK